MAEDHGAWLNHWIEPPNQEPALELQSMAVPRVEAHHSVNGPDTGRNSGGRRTKKNNYSNFQPEDANII